MSVLLILMLMLGWTRRSASSSMASLFYGIKMRWSISLTNSCNSDLVAVCRGMSRAMSCELIVCPGYEDISRGSSTTGLLRSALPSGEAGTPVP